MSDQIIRVVELTEAEAALIHGGATCVPVPCLPAVGASAGASATVGASAGVGVTGPCGPIVGAGASAQVGAAVGARVC